MPRKPRKDGHTVFNFAIDQKTLSKLEVLANHQDRFRSAVLRYLVRTAFEQIRPPEDHSSLTTIETPAS